MTVCKFFAAGHCLRGDSCDYSHEYPSRPDKLQPTRTISSELLAVINKVSNTAQPVQDQRSQVPCHYYARGYCRNGDACPYSHLPRREEIVQTSDTDEIQVHDDFTRDLSGGLVQFDRGAQVSKVSFPADFSAVRITGLPVNTSQKYVYALLSGVGIGLPPDCVRIARGNGITQTSAEIRVEDPSFSGKLCAKFDTKNASLGPQCSQLKAAQIPVNLSSRAINACRVERRKVHCSWFKPSRTVWLNFGSEYITNQVFKKFTSKTYRILGQEVHCNPPTKSPGVGKNPLAWTLMLTGLPATVTKEDVKRAIKSPQDMPRNIELGKPSYNFSGQLASATVMSMLTKVGPVEWSQVSMELGGKRAKAIARFYEEEDAQEAARSLHDKLLPFGHNMKLTVQLMSTAKFKVAATIYSAVESRIRTASHAWEQKHLNFKVHPSASHGDQYRVLVIEGPVVKDVAAAKDTINEILEGVKITTHGKSFWNPSLDRNGNTFQKLKKIEQDHRVIVIRDRIKKELRIYGSPERCKRAEPEIIETINAESTTNYCIELDHESFQWVCNGGFRTIVSSLGENVATFDIVSTPKRILIEGSQEKHEAALKIIKKRELKLVAQTDTKQDCPVCLTQAENPVYTKCDHVYCIECFENLCMAAGSGAKGFLIKCLGEKGNCQVIFSLEELQENLSSKAFEDVLEASFASYVQRHPHMLRYCPKPDCGMVYRASTTAKFNTCARCLTVTCTSCHASHEGETCAEYKDKISGGYQATQNLKKTLGIKDCPKCMTPLEKIDGCNHMICEGCKAHLCWVCLRLFSESAQCYDHMNKEHGGIGLGYLNAIPGIPAL